MNRRTFLCSSGALCAGFALGKALPGVTEAPSRNGWRTFDVVTDVELRNPKGASHIWLPAALITESPFQRTLSNHFVGDGATVKLVEDKRDTLGIVSATFPANVKPKLTLTSRVSLKDYTVDLSTSRTVQHRAPDDLSYFLRSTRYVPTDGMVKDTALKATAGAVTDTEKARAIYEWVVKNTFRDPKVRGCGRGDIRFMLESGDLGGKCADLNSLYVGLARAVGLPARHAYGVRIAKSEFGYKSLRIAGDNATKAQHCRSEVYLREYGWVPVDPADVRKVILEEPPGNRPLSDPMVERARERLFGSWEMNWMAYNYGHDVALPGSAGKPLVYFMYPQAETEEGRVDPFDAANFEYSITVKEVA